MHLTTRPTRSACSESATSSSSQRCNLHLTPRSYLEIGTDTGASLEFVNCDAITVDPQFRPEINATGNRSRTFFFQMPSDTFSRTKMCGASWVGQPLRPSWTECTGSNSCFATSSEQRRPATPAR